MTTTDVRSTVYHTGQVCPESAVWKQVGCSACSPGARFIPLTKGERFPPCGSCRNAARWKWHAPA